MANESMDENKLAIFKLGLDGHSMSVVSMKPEWVPEVIEELEELEKVKNTMDSSAYSKKRVAIINSIKNRYAKERSEIKPYSFALAYGAGPHKFGEDMYNKYWDMFSGIREYNAKTLKFAKEHKCVYSAFSGLRLKCPDINSSAKHLEEAAARTVNNFMIQSGNFLLLERAAKLMWKYYEEGVLDDFRLNNLIHDAIYVYVRNDPVKIAQYNSEWCQMASENYKENQEIPLDIEVDVGFSWDKLETLSQDASPEQIIETLNKLKGGE